jgi:hypothetical protein
MYILFTKYEMSKIFTLFKRSNVARELLPDLLDTLDPHELLELVLLAIFYVNVDLFLRTAKFCF